MTTLGNQEEALKRAEELSRKYKLEQPRFSVIENMDEVLSENTIQKWVDEIIRKRLFKRKI